jgi:NADH-quinone oxidoreductase subunit F
LDLRLLVEREATAEERAAVDAVLGAPESAWEGGARRHVDSHVALGGHEARGRRHLLLPVLQAVQERVGWISRGALDYVCERLTVPPADAHGVATFYALLSVHPRPPRTIHVCEDLACRCAGSDALIAQLEERFGAEEELSADGSATWLRSPCLGQCDRAPAALVADAGAAPREAVLAPVDVAGLLDVLDGGEPTPPAPRARSTPTAPRAVTRRSAARSSSVPRASSARSRTRASSAAAARPSPPG